MSSNNRSGGFFRFPVLMEEQELRFVVFEDVGHFKKKEEGWRTKAPMRTLYIVVLNERNGRGE